MMVIRIMHDKDDDYRHKCILRASDEGFLAQDSA